MKISIKTIGLLAALALGLASPLFSQVPDLTKEMQSVNRKLTYNLGATGMRGWIHTKAETSDDANYGRTTGVSRQILVTHVGANSPADGVMQVDDVILGIDDQPFTADARKSIALAIQEADKSPVCGAEGNPKKTSSGSLVLLRWRAGKPQIPALRELIASFNAEVENREFPGGDLNNQRVGAVENAIKSIEAAQDHPPLRSTTSASAK